MQPLQRIFNQVGASLGALPANTKVLAAALLVIVLLALLLVSQYAGQRDMLPLGLTSASMDVRTDALTYLDGADIPYEDRGSDIYVPAELRLNILGRLNEQKIVAVDEINFNSLIDLGSNPLHSQAHQRQMLLIAKMNAVKGMIAVRRDVGFVDIVIDEKSGLPGIGQARIPAVAIVSIQMRGEPMTQEFADAIGRMVAGAQAGLKLEDVTVVDLTSMKHFRPRSDDSPAASGYLEQQARIEEHYRKRFEPMLAHIPGAVVTVTAVVRNIRQTTRETTVDEPRIAPVSSETRDYEFEGDEAGDLHGMGSIPGSNIAARIGRSGRNRGAVETMTREERESKFGGTETFVEDNTGYALQVNAVVGIPRSFLLKLFDEEQRSGGVSASADPAVFQAFVEDQTARLETDLAPLIRTDPLEDAVPGEINVWMLPDINAQRVAADIGSGSADTAGMLQAAADDSGMIRNVGLSALALLSVVTMFVMLRKAGARNGHGGRQLSDTLARVPAGVRSGEAASEAVSGEGGAEEATLRTQQLLQQINQMVSGSADEAADLIEQWVATNGRR